MLDMGQLKDKLTPIYQVEPIITHLLHADNILIRSKATKESAHAINRTMQMMQQVASLMLSDNKSNIVFSKGARYRQDISDIIKVKPANLPIVYLGIPLSQSKLKARDFGLLIDKINKKTLSLE